MLGRKQVERGGVEKGTTHTLGIHSTEKILFFLLNILFFLFFRFFFLLLFDALVHTGGLNLDLFFLLQITIIAISERALAGTCGYLRVLAGT